MHDLFENRVAAGRQLAEVLRGMALADPVVLALPRGGVPVAAEVARALKAPLDLLLVRKIGAPSQPELAIAAVADGPEPDLEVDQTTLAYSGATMEHVRREMPYHLKEIERRRRLYLQGRAPLPVEGRTAVLIDDGIATGTTMRAAIKLLRKRRPARIVLAVPVAPAEEAAQLRAEVDDFVCLATPSFFGSVGAHYRDFDQTSDDEVVALMREAAAPPA